MTDVSVVPGAIAPAPAVMHLLPQFDRDKLGSAIEVLIALLDAADPDPEAEDATDLEDDFDLSPVALRSSDPGPGCTISDSDCCPAKDDQIIGSWDARPGDPEDAEVARAEWQSLSAAERRAGRIDGRASNAFVRHVAEDAEDDDADTGVEDSPLGFDPEEDLGAEDEGEIDEGDHGRTPDWGIDQTRALPEAMVIAGDRAGTVEHRKRIRATRCDCFTRFGQTHYRLRDSLSDSGPSPR
jgi:hypothetical protein